MEFPLIKVDRPATIEPVEPPRFGSYYPAPASQSMPLRDYWGVLVRHRWAVLGTCLAVLSLTALISLRMTRLYVGEATIAVYPENNNPLGFKDEGTSPPGSEDDLVLETQAKVLQSDPLGLEVIKKLDLANQPGFAGKLASKVDPASIDSDPYLQQQLLGEWKKFLTVEKIPKTRLVNIEFLSPDPKIAAAAANALCEVFREENLRARFDATMQTSDWLTKQLADLRMKVENSQEKLVRYQQEKGILGIDEKQNIITQKLDQLNQELTNAEAARIQAQAAYDAVQKGDSELVPEAAQSALLEKLKEQQADLTRQSAQMAVLYGPTYPKAVELKQQLDAVNHEIAAELSKIKGRLQKDFQTAQTRENLIRASLDSQKKEANELNQSGIEYNVLKRDADTSRQLYDSLLEHLKEAGVTAGLQSTNIRVVAPARLPVFPAVPNIPRNFAIGTLASLVLGVSLAFVLESVDNTVKSLDDVSQLTQLPALGLIPFEDKVLPAKKPVPLVGGEPSLGNIVSIYRPHSQAAEAYRALRTSILLSNVNHPPKVLLVTSAAPQEGKTTTSLNAAAVLAQKGAKVLVVDADLRRPGINTRLGIRPGKGLSNVLAEGLRWEDATVRLPHTPGLCILPAGPIPPQPSELLSSGRMREVVEQWKQNFDHIIVDSPPCLSVTDAVTLSIYADSVMIVVRAGQTRKEALRRVRDVLAQVNAKVRGVVLNCVQRGSSEYYYTYGYGPYKKYFSRELSGSTEDGIAETSYL